MASKIEEIIEELEEYINTCKPAAFSSSKVVVNRDEMEVLLADLKTHTPEEIRQYQKIISNQEAIMADAKRKADNIIQKAQAQTTELLSEHQIMQQAYVKANEVVMIANKKAQEILDSATNDANEIRQGAISYTDDLLRTMQEIIANSMETTKTTQDNYLNTMKQYMDIITENRLELSPSPAISNETIASSNVVNEQPNPPQENNNAAEPENHTKASNEKPSEEYVDTLQGESVVIDIPDKFFRKE